MLTRQLVAVGGALAAIVAVGVGPAVADGDDAGWGDGDMWASADEQTEGDGSGSGDGGGGGDGSGDDGGDDGGSASSSNGNGDGDDGDGDGCADPSLTSRLLLGQNGFCAYVPSDSPDGDDPGEPEPTVVDARDQAERAFDRLSLETANVRMAPSPPLPTYPNLETWFWVPESQWQPLTLSVTAGSTTVHVEARPVRLKIDSGERAQAKYSGTSIDSTFACSGPGRPWEESLGDDAQTSCGYAYQTTSADNPTGGDRYRLTATIVYEGSWTCAGQCTDDGGSLGETTGPTGTQLVDVQERQSVVVE